jgi:23S rRNA (guanosine2251-2'-O)-methyltransferase
VSQIEGRRPVIEALRARRPIDEILVASGTKMGGALSEIMRLAERRGVRVREVTRRELDERAESRNPQGVIATASGFAYASLDDVLARADASREPALLVAVDGVTDPQNLGALARSCEGAGAHGLVVPQRRAAPVTASAEKAASGAFEHLAVARVPNLARALEDLKERGLWIAALDSDAPRSIYDLPADDPLCLVVGGEGAGVSRLVADRADHRVSIPMSGRVASLNVAAAGAVALFDIRRRRTAPPTTS